MAGSTQPRGAGDTSRRGATRDLASRTPRRLRIALVAAAVLHAPFTPLVSFVPWLARWFEPSAKDWDYADGDVVIPIELDEAPQRTIARAPEPAPPAPDDPAHPGVAPAPKPPLPPTRDAGAPDAPSERDAGGRDAGPDAPAEAGDASGGDAAPDRALASDATDAASTGDAADVADALAPPDAPGDPDAGAALASVGADAGSAPAVRDTLGLTGDLTKTVKGKPNVVLVLWFSSMREHPLGRVIGDLLSCNPQWRDFLGDDIDPVRDLDGIMLSGPQLTNSSKVTVAVQHHLPVDKVKRMIGGLVTRSADAGGWMDGGAGELLARAHADRADRVVFTHPRGMVFVTPPEGYEQIRALKQPMSLPSGDGRSMSLTLATPWRPLRALQIAAPETLTELRLDIVATDDGGANVSIELDDRDPDSARAHAEQMTEELARSPAAPFVGAQRFEADGARIGASAHLSRFKSALLLGFVRAVTCPAASDAGAR